MIIVRNVFQVKFGKSKEAVALWKEGLGIAARLGHPRTHSRLLTDLVGDFYTLVVEIGFDSLADFERAGKTMFADPEWQAFYGKMLPLLESGRREIFNLVE